MMNPFFRFLALTAGIAFFSSQTSSAATPDELGSLKAKLASEKSCASALAIANTIYADDPGDVLTLQTIVRCTRGQQHINEYSAHAKELFERSRILSIIPKLLEVAQVKDLVPILREVEVKKDKSVADYLMINQIYERLGEPEKQIATLQEALKVNPGDPRLFMILASKQFETNHQDSLRAETKDFVQNSLAHVLKNPGQVYLIAYVLALAYPIPLAVGLVAIIWALAFILHFRKVDSLENWQDLKARLPYLVLAIPPLLAFRFWQTGKALPVGVLLLFICVQVFLLVNPFFARFYKPAFGFTRKVFYVVFNGTILAKRLASISFGARFLISFVTLLILGVIAPTIDIPDLKYGLIIFCSFVLYATIGSLMISFLRSRESLVTSLRWIGLAATFPFLISYLIANWQSLGTPLLFGELPSPSAIDSLVSYLIFWGVSFFLALHLGKIIAQAFIQPITEIIEKVAMIEKGAFDAKVDVSSKDEIGHLGHAINRMGQGLGKREKIEKTFRKYVDKQIAERILEGVESEVRIEGQKIEAVVMFADIRGFTTMSERTSPEDVVKMLNEFFERMVKIVQAHGGVIDKFIGDNMMVVWGTPRPVANAEKKAVSAGLAMLKEMHEWNHERVRRGSPELGIGIGINRGELIAGSIGSSDHMEYTVVGDTVNTAQRAESIAKRQQLVVTDAMYEKVKHLVMSTPLEPVKVKGKEGLQQWHSVNGFADQTQAKAA